MKNTWKRPNWDELIPEAKTTPFRCGDCDKMTPATQCWEATRGGICSICDDCKNKRDKKTAKKGLNK